MDFKAAMFDFDGTITEKGNIAPTQEMADSLVNLAQKMPIAFCTGRQLESFEDRGLKYLMEEIDPKKLEGFLENLYLMAENGAVGYKFNTDLDEFEEFYRAKWPYDFVNREKLMEQLDAAIKEYGSVYYNAHRVIVVMRTILWGIPEDDKNISEVYYYSSKIYEIVTEFLEEIGDDFEKFLHIGDAGIGVVVCPAGGDKDTAITKFGEYLEKNRGISFGKKYREIMVVGDRPQKGGNDYYFLNGKYGTPFTVGETDKNQNIPKPVLNSKGEKLMHSKGTLYLIKSIDC